MSKSQTRSAVAVSKLALCAAGLLAASSFASESSAQDGGPLLAAAAGGAEQRVHPRMPWRAVQVGAEVRFGAELRCREGCTVRWSDGSRVQLEPGSIAVVDEPVHMRFVPGAAAFRSDRFGLRRGAAWLDRPADALQPMTMGDAHGPIGAAGPGRTRVVATGGKTAFASLSSPGYRRTSHGWTPLPPRYALSAPPGGSAAARPLVATPSWSDAAGLAPVAIASPLAQVGAGWQAASGVAKYRVEVAKEPGFADDVRIFMVEQSRFQTALEPGVYWMRVTSIDSDGLESAPSAPRRLAVIPMALPPGGSVSGTRVALPSGTSAKLSDLAGVEAAVGASGFIRASMAAIAAPNERRSLRLRVVGDPLSETVLSVEPRALRADVRIAPALPRWPTDPIEITVEVADPSGLADIAGLDPTLQVLVGVEPAAVRFAEISTTVRTGQTRVFHGRLEPRRGKVPTVVRVSVADEQGVEIGRGFVEIASTRAP